MFHKFPAFFTATLLILTCISVFGCRFKPDLTIIYSNDILGELENCGCDEKQLGSLSRKAAGIDMLKKQGGRILNLDAGNLFFRKKPINNFEKNEFLLKSDYILKAYNRIRPDALNIGGKDLLFGTAQILRLKKQAGFPFLSANILYRKTGQPVFTPFIIKKTGTKKIGIIGLCGKFSSPPPEIIIADPLQTAQKWVAFLAGKCDYIIVLSTLDLKNNRLLAEQVQNISLIITSAPEAAVAAPVRTNKTWIVWTVIRGQYLGKLEALPQKGMGLKLESRHIALDGSAGEDPEIKEVVRSYKNALTAMNKQLFFKSALKAKDGRVPEDLYYLGADTCGECHLPQYENWKKTFHAEAYHTLKKEDNHYSAECLPCHTLGYGEPGGFDIAQRSGTCYVNVQCESCHGPGSHHSEKNGIIRNIGRKGCLTCHDKKNSPQFDYQEYLHLVKCPTGNG